jgi:PAS domain S-box-containing protein
MTDISELKKKEESEKILNSAIQHASDAIIIFNSEGEIRSWNKGGKMIFGYKKEEMVGQKIDKLFSIDQLANFFKKRSGFYNLELKTRHKNAKSISIAATLTTIQSEDKNTVYYLLIARDITTQMQFQEEMALKYQKIQEAYVRFGVIRRQMDYIFEILELLSTSADKKTIADYVVSSLIMLSKTDACMLRVYNKEKDSLEMVSSFGIQDADGKASIKRQDSLVQKAFEKRTPLKIIDIASEPRYQSAYLAKKNNLASLLLIPLTFQGQLIGSLSLYADPNKKLAIFENEFIEKHAKIIEVAIYTVFFKNA